MSDASLIPPLPSGKLDEAVNREGTDSRKMQGRHGKFLGRDPAVVPLWVADMDFRSPQPIVDALVERASNGVYGYTDCPPQLAAALVERLKTVYGCTAVEPEPSWFRWTPGLLPMLNHAVRASCTPGVDAVAIPTPVYPPFLDAAGNNNVGLIKVPLVEAPIDSVDVTVSVSSGQRTVKKLAPTLRYEIDWPGLEAALADPACKLLHFCNPHNPAGRCWTRTELAEVARLCVAHDVILCSDEVWGDVALTPDAHPFVSMLSLLATEEDEASGADAGEPDAAAGVPGLKSRLIILTSPSKCFNVAPLDIAVGIVPDDSLRRRFRAVGADSAETGVFGYVAATVAYTDPECEAWRLRLIDYLKANRDYAAARLQRMGIQCVVPEASYLMWMDAVNVLPEEAKQDAEEFFLAGGVGLSGGKPFGGGPTTVRLNFGCKREVLEEGLRRMEKHIEGAKTHEAMVKEIMAQSPKRQR